MKNLKLLAGLFLILTAFTFTSCENEPIDSTINIDDFNNPTTGTATFKADFGGNTWNSSQTQGLLTSNLISIGATKADGSAFSILINASTTGTYPANTNIISYTPAGSEFGYWSTNVSNPTENTGSITITSIDTAHHTISGTFNFKGYWSDASNTSIIPVDFTNGSFTNISYQSDTTPTGDYYLKAMQDGVAKDYNTQLQATYATLGTSKSLIILGANGTNSLSLHVTNDSGSISAAVYPLEWVNVGGNYTEGSNIFSSDYSDFTTSAGNITITEFDTTNHTIKGSFNFIAKDQAMTSSKTFTNGDFFVHYTEQ